MNYPAILTFQSTHTLITFPDLPDCRVAASVNDHHLKIAQTALVNCLRTSLRDQGSPPRPSGEIALSGSKRVIVVPVPDDLAQALEARWQWA
jgi:hypothetical protein